MLSRAIVNPIAERKREEKNEAAENQNGIQLESWKYLARDDKEKYPDQEEGRPPNKPPPQDQFGRGRCQPTRRALIGDAIGTAIKTPCHT